MFPDTNKGQTHSINDNCGESEHNCGARLENDETCHQKNCRICNVQSSKNSLNCDNVGVYCKDDNGRIYFGCTYCLGEMKENEERECPMRKQDEEVCNHHQFWKDRNPPECFNCKKTEREIYHGLAEKKEKELKNKIKSDLLGIADKTESEELRLVIEKYFI